MAAMNRTEKAVQEDKLRAAQSADTEALMTAIRTLNSVAMQFILLPQDVRRTKLHRAASYLEQQFNDACRFLMGDAL